MKKNREKSSVFLYIIIVLLALVILALGGLTLMSLNDLSKLRSKVSSLQDTVQEISDTSADLLAKADELTSLKSQSAAAESPEPAPDSSQQQEEGTLSPSHDESEISEASTDESLSNLLSQVQQLLPQNNGSWSVYVCNLIKDSDDNINSHPMQAASLIKLYIMGAVYENYETLLQSYSADTLNNYLNPMITVSDNDAANSLVEILGSGDTSAGMAVVNEFCQNHGFTDTSMGRLLLQSNENGDNYTSVNDCGRFLKEIYQTCNGTSTGDTLAHADAMYALLKSQERRNKIPAGMPDGVGVANKTGELDNVENDAAIIYNTAKGIDLVICFMSEDLNDSGSAQASIANISHSIYGYYNES